MRILVVVALALGIGAGCYSPSFGDCQLTCGTSGMCPAGYDCKLGLCRIAGASGACQGTDGGGGSDGGSRVTLASYGEFTLEQRCAYLVRCGVADDVQSCVETFSSSFVPLALGHVQTANLLAAEAAGRLVFHADKAEACYAGYPEAACTRDQLYSERLRTEDCLGVFEGTVAAGGDCAIREECISQQCDFNGCVQDANGCCIGQCTGAQAPSVLAANAVCRPGIDLCMPGLYCDTSDPANMMCKPYKTTGQFCNSTLECADSSYCDTPGMPNAMCKALVGNLGTCSANEQCRDNSNLCSAGKCQVAGLEGSDCSSTVGSACQQLHSCVSGTCLLPPGVGQACPTGQFCRGDAYCSNQQCVPRLDDGAACPGANGNGQCSSDYCDPNQLQCAERPVCF